MVDLTLPDPSPSPESTPDIGDAAARLVARVQAWQHRHPLARRLHAADVNGLGAIALPFGPPASAGGKLQPLFHQPSLVPGLSHRALVEFAQHHAVKYRPGPTDWPLREVERADASPDPAPETLYLLTAAITEPVKPGAQPRRLLIAPESPAIWGPRPLSRRRVAEAIGVLVLIVLALVWGQRGRLKGSAPAAAPAVVAAPPASVPPVSRPASLPSSLPSSLPASPAAASATPTPASVAHLPVPAAPLPAVPASVAARAVPASTPAAAASAAIPASAARPASSPAGPPSSAAAIAASAPRTPASVALPPPPRLLPMPALRGATSASAAASAPSPAASAAVSPAGPHFALVSLPSKKRAGAEETLARIHKLLGPAIGNLQAQIMPSPDGFVVTIWPLPTEADAEQMANVLARRGVPMKWLEF